MLKTDKRFKKKSCNLMKTQALFDVEHGYEV